MADEKGSSGSWYHNTMKPIPKDIGKVQPPTGDGPHFGWYAPPQYDATPEEIDRIRRRAEIRRNLKKEFLRKNYDPFRLLNQVDLMDPAVNRWMAMRASIYEHWKPTWKGFFKYVGFVIFPFYAYGKTLNYRRLKYDQKCRYGEIPYDQRVYKNV